MNDSAAWHEQAIEQLCAAAIRALSGEASVHFRGRRPHRGNRRLPVGAPHLRPSFARDDFGSFRGAADGMALRLSHSDDELHRRLRPSEPVPRLVFEMLEQFRVESLAAATMPGMVHNLRHRHEQWSLAFHHAGHTETARGILLYTLAQMCRARVTGQPVVAETQDLIEATRFRLAPRLGHDLLGLRRHRADQESYAGHALAIARVAGELVHDAGGQDADSGSDDPGATQFALLLDLDDEPDDEFAKATTGHSTVFEDAERQYRVFTTAYDTEHAVPSLARPALLREYRERLDQQIAGQGINIARLVRQLRLLLTDPARDGWDGGQEEGHVDGRRLAQLIASPTERRLFRTERTEPVASCLVTFLVDCSGSMKEHAESVAVIVDVFARALDLAGIRSEILGFTTGAWNGGRAFRDWRRVRRPRNPGRVNEVCHLVFKDADTSYRRARPAIAGLLKQDLFREGVDGEAVAWACGRMRRHAEERRLLLVFSDGSPMDSATALANDAHCLDNHLADVVQRHEADGSAEIYGVGLGLDLSPYYRRAVALDLSHGVGNGELSELVRMLAGLPS